MGKNAYPVLEINLPKLKNNIDRIVDICSNAGIGIAGVIKGVNALMPIIQVYENSDCKQIASSRIRQLKAIKENGINKQLMLIRIPMLSEIEEVVKYCDISLNSELVTLEALNEEAIRQNKIHQVVIMADLGDLREGYFNDNELITTCIKIENNMEGLHLAGIGTNLGCYGSIKPTATNLGKLSDIATAVEEKINRKLEIISGGATSSLPLILDGKMPSKINHLRIGEGILLGRDLPDFWNYNIEGIDKEAFKLKAQIVEIKEKPSYPVGEIFIDAFGNTPEYTDVGNITRAIFAIGKQDIGDFDKIKPIDKRIKLIGSSSDHLIADVTDINNDVKIGDVFEFELFYQSMLFATESLDVKKEYIY